MHNQPGMLLVQRQFHVPRHDLSTLERLPEELLDDFWSNIVFADFFLHVELPAEDFLIGETAEGLGELKLDF